jgi:integrase
MLDREVELVLAALTETNRLVMRTALHTGLRIGDVLALKPADLRPHFWVTEQKTGKRRQIGLPEPLLSDLKKHAGEHWVFAGRDPAKHHTRQAVWKDVKRAAAAFRLRQNVAPHSARKVYAVELMKKYGDIAKVQRAMKHRNEAVTMIYALADMQLEAKYRRRRSGNSRKKS